MSPRKRGDAVLEGGDGTRGDVFADLRRSFEGLTQSQKRIAEAIVADPEFIAFSTVDKVGTRLGLSPSTIVRFTYKIGLNGYQDLQDRVRELVRTQIRNAQSGDDGEPVSPTGHLRDTPYGASFERDIQNLRRTVAHLSAELLDRAVDELVQAQTLYVVGGLASDAITEYVSMALDRTRGNTVRLQANGRTPMRLADCVPGDALLAFSFPPYSTATLRVVEHARENGLRSVGITDSPISPIGQRVDVVLPAHVSGVGLQNSLVAPMGIVNALLNAVALRLPGAVERHRQVMRLMNQWNNFVLKDEEEPEG